MKNKTGNEPIFASTDSRRNSFSVIQEDLAVRKQRQHLFPRAALVGLVGAGLSPAFYSAIPTGAYTLRNVRVVWSQNLPLWGWIFPLLFSMTSALLSALLVVRYSPTQKAAMMTWVVFVTATPIFRGWR